MSSVLFDVPGPEALRRQRRASVVTIVILVILAALVLYKLQSEGQLDGKLWEPFVTPIYIQALLEGALTTLQVAVVAIALSVFFGALLAVARLSDHVWVQWPATLVVEFFRAVPVLMMILAISLIYGDTIGKFWSLVIGLVLYNGSVLAEVFRAGINAVPRGQSEASYALGLTKGQVMQLILLPQAVKIMLPAIISQSVVTLKDTSLGYVIPYEELTNVGRAISIEFTNILPVAIVIAAMFILVNYSLSRFATWLEERMGRATGGSPTELNVGV